MKQQQFEAKFAPLWQRFDLHLQAQSKHKAVRHHALTELKKLQPLNFSGMSDGMNEGMHNARSGNRLASADNDYEFVRLYRLICQHYALAKQRHYSPALVNQLHEQVLVGHSRLYQHQSHVWSRIYRFYRHTFPRRLRAHANLFWLSLAVFLLPALLMGWACFEHSDMLYSVMPESQVRSMEQMYNPANEMVGRDSSRQSDTDLMMFGHYIRNNIGIDFQIYGMGIFAGIGTLLSLLYNGLVIGGVAGHLTGIGFSETFWSFVAGHGSFELTAAVISGAAGLRLAQSLFMPGNYTRLDAFKIAGKQSIELLIGAASMTFIAAFIEAFWSSSTVVPNLVKYVVAVGLWALVIGYLVLAGRQLDDVGNISSTGGGQA